MPGVVLAYEAKFIREALEVERGSVSRAAKRLGIAHQSLAHILKTRQRNLLTLRTPAQSRRRGVITAKPADQRPVTILHVEDNQIVANAVKTH